MASLAAETQLEKDVANKSGVIPIWPWLDGDGNPKDGVPPHLYANMLLEAKRQNDENGAIIRCSDPKCERVGGIGNKSMFWRSEDTSERIVPPGWANYGGMDPYIICPNCRAIDIHDHNVDDEEMGLVREDINLKHGSTGTSGTSDKPLRPLTVSLTRRGEKRKYDFQFEYNKELKAQAKKLFKDKPEHLEATLQEIDKEERRKKRKIEEEEERNKEEEREKRANAAEKRKRKGHQVEPDDGQRKKTKTTGGKRRRKKRTKKRRKSRRKSRRRKKRRKKRTKRRRKRRR